MTCTFFFDPGIWWLTSSTCTAWTSHFWALPLGTCRVLFPLLLNRFNFCHLFSFVQNLLPKWILKADMFVFPSRGLLPHCEKSGPLICEISRFLWCSTFNFVKILMSTCATFALLFLLSKAFAFEADKVASIPGSSVQFPTSTYSGYSPDTNSTKWLKVSQRQPIEPIENASLRVFGFRGTAWIRSSCYLAERWSSNGYCLCNNLLGLLQYVWPFLWARTSLHLQLWFFIINQSLQMDSVR